MVVFLAGGLAGVVLGALGAGLLVRWLQAAREKRALQALITQIHLKRVLAADGPGTLNPDRDAARCRSAVADVRQQVRETVSELRPGSSSATAVLLEMHRACDAYLRETEGAGRNYEARLRVLRPALNQGARRLSKGRHVQYQAPGERATVRREPAPAAAAARTATHAARTATHAARTATHAARSRAVRGAGAAAPERHPAGPVTEPAARTLPAHAAADANQ